MKDYKFYYVYQLINKVNGKIYVGMHATDDMDDGYLGSGKLIRRAVQKYGAENFEKIILFKGSCYQEIKDKEAEIVTEEFIKDEATYNLVLGGKGGFAITVDQLKEAGHLNGIENRKLGRGIFDPSYKEKNRKAVAAWQATPEAAEIRKKASELSRTESAIQKRKETFAKMGHQQGEKNSSYGKHWIHRGTENRLVKKDEAIPEGWEIGRKLK